MTKNYNLVDQILSELITDKIDQSAITGNLMHLYSNADLEKRNIINEFLIILCGNNMPMLIKKMKE